MITPPMSRACETATPVLLAARYRVLSALLIEIRFSFHPQPPPTPPNRIVSFSFYRDVFLFVCVPAGSTHRSGAAAIAGSGPATLVHRPGGAAHR